jgi:hypothetical protein
MKRIPEEIREWIRYDHTTGKMYWLKSKGKARAGAEVGTINALGYVQMRFNCVIYRGHRVAYWLYHGVEPDVVDHINEIKHDNRIANLQSLTDDENRQLTRIRSGKHGVCWCKDKTHKTGGYYRATWGTEILYQGMNQYAARQARRAAEQNWLAENPHIRIE